MDAIERAIRSALERGNATDKLFREKVYRQAFGALERALQANPSLTVETAIRRRKGLQAKITEIEAAYLPAAPRAVDPSLSDLERQLGIDPADAPLPVVESPMARPAPAPSPVQGSEPPLAAPETLSTAPRVEVVQPSRVEPVAVPRVEPDLAARGPVEPRFDELDTIPIAEDIVVQADGPTPVVPDIMVETEPEYVPAPEPIAVEGEQRATARRRPLARIFTAVVLLCAVAMGAYLAYEMGLFGANSAREQELADAQPDQPPAESEDFEPGTEGAPATAGQADPQREWVTVFAANDPSTVSAPGDAKAEAMRDTGGEFIRLTSGQSGSAILFDVGQGVLERIAGKRATFDIVARALDGQDTQMSVACNFGELGDCGRKRYAVGSTRSDYLFEIDVPTAEAGAGGTIAINSDFGNSGKSVDIFEIKVSIAPVPVSN